VTYYLRRAARARQLARKYPSAAESLEFLALVSEAQNGGLDLEGVNRLLARIAPRPLSEVSAVEADIERYLRNPDPSKLTSLHARILLEGNPPQAPVVDDVAEPACPRCGHPAQLGILRPVGEGAALSLACSLCRHEWPVSRRSCPACGSESLEFHGAAEYPATTTQSCTACRSYFHILDLGKDPEMVLEADEVAAQPLDVWAIEQGLRKIYPNWTGL
jgi:formate dehydrogenase maturation protein FdhE